MSNTFWNRLFWGDSGKGNSNEGILEFLHSLSPGIQIQLQYSCLPPEVGTFQGLQNGNVILTDFGTFKGLVRLSPHCINAVSPAPITRKKCKR